MKEKVKIVRESRKGRRGPPPPLVGSSLEIAKALAKLANTDAGKLPAAEREAVEEAIGKAQANLHLPEDASPEHQRHADFMWEEIKDRKAPAGGFDLSPFEDFMRSEILARVRNAAGWDTQRLRVQHTPMGDIVVPVDGDAGGDRPTVLRPGGTDTGGNLVHADKGMDGNPQAFPGAMVLSKPIYYEDGQERSSEKSLPFDFFSVDAAGTQSLNIAEISNLRGDHPALIVSRLIIEAEFWPWWTCQICGDLFVPMHPKAQYCSRRCSNRANHLGLHIEDPGEREAYLLGRKQERREAAARSYAKKKAAKGPNAKGAKGKTTKKTTKTNQENRR